VYGLDVVEMARVRREELLREAGERRLARALRANPLEARGARRGRPGGLEGVRVRWGIAEDEPVVADLLQLNGMPRWVAFEERFVVAERDGKVLGALRYRTESKRLLLGLLVVDPWAGEERTGAGVVRRSRSPGAGAGRGGDRRLRVAGWTIRGRPGTGGGGATGAWTPPGPAKPAIRLREAGAGCSPCSARSPCRSTDTGSGRAPHRRRSWKAEVRTAL
jgi:hypothetical protein